MKRSETDVRIPMFSGVEHIPEMLGLRRMHFDS